MPKKGTERSIILILNCIHQLPRKVHLKLIFIHRLRPWGSRLVYERKSVSKIKSTFHTIFIHRRMGRR